MKMRWQQLREQAERQVREARYEEAASTFAQARCERRAARQSASDGEDAGEDVRLRVEEGRALTSASRLPRAIDVLEDAAHEADAVLGPAHAQTVRARLALGTALFRIGRVEEAGDYWLACHRVIDSGVEVPDDIRAMVLNNLGGVYYHRGEHDDAIRCFERSLAAMEERLGTEHKETARPLSNLAWLHSEAGRPDEAERLARRAVEVTERTHAPDDPEATYGLHTLAVILSRQDRLREAVDLFERVLALTPSDDYRRATACVNLADMYRKLGDVRTARGYAREALRQSEEVLDPTDPYRTAILRSQAFVAVAEGNHHEALATLERAVAVEADVPRTSVESRIANRMALADVANATGAHASAEVNATEGLDMLRDTPSLQLPAVEAKLRLCLGVAIARQDRARGGLRELEAAEAAARRGGALSADFHHQLLDARIGVHDLAGDHQAAIRVAEEAVEVLAHTRSEEFALLDASGRTRRTARRLAWFDRVLADQAPDAARQKKRTEAWFAHHHAASTVAAAILRAQDGASERERAAADAYRATLRALAAEVTNPEDGRRSALRERLARLEKRAGSAQVEAISRALGPVRVEDVASALDDDEVLIAIAWLEQHVVTIQVTPSGEVARRVAGRSDALADAVRKARTRLQEAEADSDAHAGRLASTLLGHDAGADPTIRRMIIVPDGAAALLPWGRLVDEWRRYAGRGPVETVQSPSVRGFVAGRAQECPAVVPAAATVVADPDFGADGSTHAWRGGAAGDMVTSVAYREWLASLRIPRLQHASEEANVVRGFAPDCRTIVGADATVEALWSVRRPRVLHVATHGFVYPGADDMSLPLLRPVLALAGARTASRTPQRAVVPGFLPALAMAGMDLAGTELVVLSACESSVGSVLPGEGVAAMPQALLMAGARSVVATLWRVPDRAALEVMRGFYDYLADGLAPSTALHRLQQDSRYGGTAGAFVCWR